MKYLRMYQIKYNNAYLKQLYRVKLFMYNRINAKIFGQLNKQESSKKLCFLKTY